MLSRCSSGGTPRARNFDDDASDSFAGPKQPLVKDRSKKQLKSGAGEPKVQMTSEMAIAAAMSAAYARESGND